VIKRSTLCLEYERGGLGMFDFEARIKAIALQQYKYITKNIDSPFYSLSA
jgi:hypothetical protein